MTGKELFEIWAPSDSIWSQWASPALFAQIDCTEEGAPAQVGGPAATWHEQTARPDSAVVIDLPGADSIRLVLALAERGYRPVAIINGSPGPISLQLNFLPRPNNSSSQSVVVLDKSSLVREICGGTQRLQRLDFASDAPPAFMLDSLRLKGTNPLRDDQAARMEPNEDLRVRLERAIRSN